MMAILFAECGLLFGSFLPGDSLLFTAGLLVAGGLVAPLWVVLLLLPVAAIAGNLVGYWLGRKAGPAVFSRPDSTLFKGRARPAVGGLLPAQRLPDHRAGPLRARRPHLRHRDGRRLPDGPPPLHRLLGHRGRRLDDRDDAAGLLARPGRGGPGPRRAVRPRGRRALSGPRGRRGPPRAPRGPAADDMTGERPMALDTTGSTVSLLRALQVSAVLTVAGLAFPVRHRSWSCCGGAAACLPGRRCWPSPSSCSRSCGPRRVGGAAWRYTCPARWC